MSQVLDQSTLKMFRWLEMKVAELDIGIRMQWAEHSEYAEMRRYSITERAIDTIHRSSTDMVEDSIAMATYVEAHNQLREYIGCKPYTKEEWYDVTRYHEKAAVKKGKI